MAPFRLLLLSLALAAAAIPARAQAPDPVQRFLQARVQRDDQDFLAWAKLADHYLRLLRQRGDTAFLAKAAQAAEASLRALPAEHNPGGLGVRGRVKLAAHRFAAARETGLLLQKIQPRKSGGLVLQNDALVELGDYAGSEKALTAAVEIEDVRSVGSESRYAKLDFVQGRLPEAEKRWQEALALARDGSDPDMLAWTDVQVGEFAFRQGKWEAAAQAYAEAAENAPGWYVVEEHQAELLAAQGRYEEAAAAYEKIVARVPRPDLCQALGDLYLFWEKPEQARPWHAKARELYERSRAAGELLYLHHGSGFFADSINEPATAVKWAQEDLANRQNIYAWDTLAWAQYRAGQMDEAEKSLAKALATNTRDPHLLYHAGMIHMSAGEIKAGREALRAAQQVNPRYQTFHVHR